MTIVAMVAGAMLLVAALLALIRVVIGPTMLNRVMAVEVIVAVVVGGLALEAAYNQHTTTLPILLALAMLGFVGATSVARFVAKERA
jgi:multicomponent Na+:H+ antiporter subunit F